MPLLKRTVTPARLEANRRAGFTSTGPRSAAGNVRSSLHTYRHSGRSRAMELVWRILEAVPVGYVIPMARRNLSPAQLGNPDPVAILNQFLSPGHPSAPDKSTLRGKEEAGKSFLANKA